MCVMENRFFMYKESINVSLDRITITGSIVRHKTDITELKEYLKNSNWEYISDTEFRLIRINENDIAEHVAGLYKNPFQNSSWRLDTSNHLKNNSVYNELSEIQNVVKFMQNPKISRLDLAFDYINMDIDSPSMVHDIYRFNSSKTIYSKKQLEDLTHYVVFKSRSQKIQTIYSGKRTSGFMIRYYDKIAEQRSRKKEIPDTVKKWERLEIQLGSAEKTGNWFEHTKEMLNYFKKPVYSDMKPTDRAMFFALQEGVVSYSDLSKETRSKYRKLIKNNSGFDDNYARLAYAELLKRKSDILDEINAFVKELDSDVLIKKYDANI